MSSGPPSGPGSQSRLAFVLLFLAMGMIHFEASIGLAFLMVLASPVTVFALPISRHGGWSRTSGRAPGLRLLFLFAFPSIFGRLASWRRTYFLEKLRKEPPDGLGLSLWLKTCPRGRALLADLSGAWSASRRQTAISIVAFACLRWRC